MANAPIAYPPAIINNYLESMIPSILPEYFAAGSASLEFPFFPTTPTAIDEVTEMFPDGPPFAVYDRIFRMRRMPFPHIKSEQLLYYFYKMNDAPVGVPAVEVVIEVTQAVQDLLDRGDESAQEINEWLVNHPRFDGEHITFGSGIYAKKFKPVFFHNLKVYQIEEVRDIVDFGTARTFAGNKVILDYTYHIPKDYNDSPLTPVYNVS